MALLIKWTGKMVAGARKKSDKTKYYEILGVSKHVLPRDLKTAYTKLAIQIQPDSEKFKELAKAYQVLSDPVKRLIYNQFGEEAVKKAGCSSRAPLRMVGQDIVIHVAVTLADLYNGRTRMLPFPHRVTCPKCKGKGCKSGLSMKCSDCQGSGMKPRVVHLGPPMIQLPFSCYECNATGEAIREIINDEDRCEQCMGEKVVEVVKVVKVNVEKGMKHGQLIEFPKELLQLGPEFEKLGAVFMLRQQVHPKFERKGDDLFVEHTLSFKEAMYGFQFGLTHLDNRELIIKSQPGEVVKPGQLKEINDEGMPIYQKPFKRGKLYIRFTVEFPDLKPIEAVLPPETLTTAIADREEVETATSPLLSRGCDAARTASCRFARL